MSIDATPAASPTRDQHATSTLLRIWNRTEQMLDWASEYCNPILVKETRQALKSQQFVLWFLLLLAACWIITIGGIAWLGPGVQYAASGGLMFLAYYYVLAFALVVVVPFGAFRSLAAEQEDNTCDVLMVSALTPRQLIDGKVGSAALQMTVYLSALAPCLAFTYLLRGIDLLTIFLLPMLAVLASVGLSLVGLLLASSAKQRYTQVLSSVGFVILLLSAFYWCTYAAYESLKNGYQMYQSTGFWASLAGILTFYFCASLITYLASVALNTFISANRSTTLRRALLFTQMCFVGWIAGLWFHFERESAAIIASSGVIWMFWGFAGSMLTGEQAVLSERVRRELPVSTFGRLFTSLMNPGPGTGYLFTVANVASLGALMLVGTALSDQNSSGIANPTAFFLLGTAYVIASVGLGRLIVAVLRRFATLSLLGCFLIHFLMQLAGAGFAEIIRSSISRYGRLPFNWFDIASPIKTLIAVADNATTPSETLTALCIVSGIAACTLLLNLALAAREIQQTRTPIPQRVLEDNLELKPTEELVANPWGDIRRDA